MVHSSHANWMCDGRVNKSSAPLHHVLMIFSHFLHQTLAHYFGKFKCPLAHFLFVLSYLNGPRRATWPLNSVVSFPPQTACFTFVLSLSLFLSLLFSFCCPLPIFCLHLAVSAFTILLHSAGSVTLSFFPLPSSPLTWLYQSVGCACVRLLGSNQIHFWTQCV